MRYFSLRVFGGKKSWTFNCPSATLFEPTGVRVKVGIRTAFERRRCRTTALAADCCAVLEPPPPPPLLPPAPMAPNGEVRDCLPVWPKRVGLHNS